MSAGVAGNEVVREVAVAVAVAEAVRALPGVARLQPRLWGLVQQVTRDMWERTTGKRYPDVSGVEVTLHRDGSDPHSVTLEIGLVIRAEFTAARVAVAAQHAAAAAATAASGLPVTSVAVYVSDVERAASR